MHELSVFWLRAAAALYAIGLFHTLQVAIRKSSPIFRAALLSFLAGLVLHFVAIIENGLASGASLASGFVNSISLCAFLFGLLFVVVYWKYRIESLGTLMFPLVFVMTAVAAVQTPLHAWTTPAARSTWLVVHIILVLLGYAAIVMTTLASVLYLLQERQLKRKKPLGILAKLPPLGTLDSIVSKSLGLGFVLITVGVVTGATWAWIDSQGQTALSDPRMTTALLTWLACFLMVALRITAGWRGRKAALMAVAVVACSAATWAVHYVQH